MKAFVIALIVLVLLAVVGAGAFVAGAAYGRTEAQNVRAEFLRDRQPGAGQGDSAMPGQGARGVFIEGGRAAAVGTVKSIDGNTLVVTQRDGSAVTVTIDSQTIIQKLTAGTAADLQPGQNVTVMSRGAGTPTGGAINAQMIQIRPAGP